MRLGTMIAFERLIYSDSLVNYLKTLSKGALIF